MEFIQTSIEKGIATVALNRPKVNAINEPLLEELAGVFEGLTTNTDVSAVILTGQGRFFSFGFDVPEFMDYDKENFTNYVHKFSKLVRAIFMYPKPVIAAINGHSVAGGTVLTLACDKRVMVSGKPMIALNELTFGSTVFTSLIQMLRFTIGGRAASKILYTGKMFTAEEALDMGLIDQAASEDELIDAAKHFAHEMGHLDQVAYQSVKTLLKKEYVEIIDHDEEASISEFVDIWYSERTRENLKKIVIRN